MSALSDGQILVASLGRCLGLLETRGEPIWTIPSPVLDFRDQADIMKVSADGKTVNFGYRGSSGAVLQFDLRSLTLSNPPPNEALTFAPIREGLAIDGWQDGRSPTLGGRALPLRS